jgi:hypothetical protein
MMDEDQEEEYYGFEEEDEEYDEDIPDVGLDQHDEADVGLDQHDEEYDEDIPDGGQDLRSEDDTDCGQNEELIDEEYEEDDPNAWTSRKKNPPCKSPRFSKKPEELEDVDVTTVDVSMVESQGLCLLHKLLRKWTHSNIEEVAICFADAVLCNTCSLICSLFP